MIILWIEIHRANLFSDPIGFILEALLPILTPFIGILAPILNQIFPAIVCLPIVGNILKSFLSGFVPFLQPLLSPLEEADFDLVAILMAKCPTG